MAPSRPEDDFLRELRATFRMEAQEHLQAIGTGLVTLESSAEGHARAEVIENVFRAAHSLKGAARSVDLRGIETQCQVLEEIFAGWKRLGRMPSAAALDAAHRALDSLGAALQAARAAEPPQAGTAARSKAEAEDTVRIAVSKLDTRLATAEEMLTVKLAAAHRADELNQLAAWFDTWRRQWHPVAAKTGALRHALAGAAAQPRSGNGAHVGELLDFLEFNVDHIRRLEGTLAALARDARQDRHVVGQLVDDLLEESKKLLLLPFASVTAALPKLVRDLCRDQGKEADLVVRGGEVEIDRRVLEEMKDPLIHLLRNSIDHGIETRERRAAAGKPPRAAITLTVSRMDAGKVALHLADDGCGIDIAKVKEAAVAHGLLPAGEAGDLADGDALDLIFRTGLSTSPAVTRVSGRGLGLAIVREKAEKLGGSVSVRSEMGRGTGITILLPAVLATFRGILVEATGAVFVAPSAQVERVARVKAADIVRVEGRETIALGGRTIALVMLAEVLELAGAAAGHGDAFFVMVLGAGEQRVGFVVDAVIEELEVLVKPFSPPLTRVRNVSGATVLASGQIAPILHVPDLLKSARKATGLAASQGAAAPARAKAAKTILVAEDSITSRMLLKGILEAAGYQVKTAVDGMEAFALLRSYRFDLVVSDVDMPRLSGVALTAKVRADARLASLPVILVTTLDSREDRERGADAGADAYIVKSRFDQSDLLDAVRRLMR